MKANAKFKCQWVWSGGGDENGIDPDNGCWDIAIISDDGLAFLKDGIRISSNPGEFDDSFEFRKVSKTKGIISYWSHCGMTDEVVFLGPEIQVPAKPEISAPKKKAKSK